MIIKQKRIRNLKSHLPDGLINQEIYICIPMTDFRTEQLQKIGFKNLTIGEKVVPAPLFKSIAYYNANGSFRIRKDLPKETFTIEREWHWTLFNGEEQSRIVYIDRERYHREAVPAPEEALTIFESSKGTILVSSRKLVYTADSENALKHIINLFLEIFGQCSIHNSRLDEIIPAPTIRLNWNVLPKGKTPWEKVHEALSPLLARTVKPSMRTAILDRFDRLNKLNPDFVAIGNGGFYGYLVYGFPSKNKFILESIYSGNAIYVLGADWAEVSKLSKSEIIKSELMIERIVHKDFYWNRVSKYIA